MATEKTTVDNVGPIASQLKQSFSALERSQLATIKNLGAAVTQKPGATSGDVSQVVSRVNGPQRSAMEIGANIASKLERSGAVIKSAEKAMQTAISSTVHDKISLPKKFPKPDPDLSAVSNRIPNPYPKGVQEKIQDKKDRLLGEADYQYNGIDYPPDLTTQAPAHVELEFQQYTRGSPFAAGKITGGTIIRLPIPENLNVYHSIRYEERDTNYYGEMAKAIAQDQAGKDAIEEARKGLDQMDVKNVLSGLGSAMAGGAMDTLQSYGATKLIESEPELGGLAGQMAGAIPNPHPTVFFKGLDLRNFDWTWKFVPRSELEAATIGAILRIIKQNILPKNGGTFMDYPNLVQPRIFPEAGLWGEFKRSAIKNFSLNFTGEGTSAFFVNGDPVSIICNIQFQEIEAFISDTSGG